MNSFWLGFLTGLIPFLCFAFWFAGIWSYGKEVERKFEKVNKEQLRERIVGCAGDGRISDEQAAAIISILT